MTPAEALRLTSTFVVTGVIVIAVLALWLGEWVVVVRLRRAWLERRPPRAQRCPDCHGRIDDPSPECESAYLPDEELT